MRQFFSHERFVHGRGHFFTGEILKLSKGMNAPFYISQDQIVLFNHEHIVMCKLCGSVTLWLENFS
jgi:Tat protein secretion system quality control protein TatD with DNase activity